ncbi:hypothetical protein O0L34_g6529 [Tuta absoluta]|nr:hypothetical protein O0L34_g6529 [Tuta absoluta]
MELVVVSLLVIGLVYGSPVEEVELLPPLNSTEHGTGNHFTNEIQSRIVNGQRAQPGQFPWQALLGLQGEKYFKLGRMKLSFKAVSLTCGASLISKQHLITAAHCVSDPGSSWIATTIEVELGSTRRGNGVSVCTQEYFVHPKWNMEDLENDIAIIRIPTAYDQIKGYNPKLIAPISLPASSGKINNDFVGHTAIASGFGITHLEEKNNDNLNYVSLKVINNKLCSYRFGVKIDETKICTSPDIKPYSSACLGDSGGPLVINKSSSKQILVGVASFVQDGCSSLSVFTRITSYKNFICQYATDLKYNCR